MADWDITPRAQHCSVCAKPFAPGDSGHSLLFQEGEALQRQDLCPACYGALPKERLQAALSAWTFTTSTTPKASNKKEEPVARDAAETLLRTLLQRNAPQDVAPLYILAILLERNKRLIERKTTTAAAGKVHLYEHKATGELIPITDPNITPESLPEVQQRVLTLLQTPPTPPPTLKLKRQRRATRPTRYRKHHR